MVSILVLMTAHIHRVPTRSMRRRGGYIQGTYPRELTELDRLLALAAVQDRARHGRKLKRVGAVAVSGGCESQLNAAVQAGGDDTIVSGEMGENKRLVRTRQEACLRRLQENWRES